MQKKADEFNKIFTNIGTELVNKISNASKPFDFYITKVNISMESQPLSISELKDAFSTLKTRNATCCNNRDDLFHLSFTLKVSVFSEAYI